MARTTKRRKKPKQASLVVQLRDALKLAHAENNGYIQRLLADIDSLRRGIQARDLLIEELKTRLADAEALCPHRL